ncbi:hypothetical protein [Nocardia otitidiscaviarum]|uniref:hypothetical protein n=1 Tax=Nocardia otitidiscaviarum TaxID=1823 RepID=UPI001895AC08|nr:hypothetical protein [Nocardia otitidiscaviarum]MBF6176969.1 hypothetical protein [Nocardia otitidiscaviarum]
MRRTSKFLMIASLLPVVAAAGCTSDDTKTNSSPTGTTSTTTTTVPTATGNDDPGEATGAERVPLGQTKVVIMPADAVLDIKGLQEWDRSALRCTATSASGEGIELLPPPADAEPEQGAQGATWVPLWTVGATPGELTIGCSDPEGKIPDSANSFVRVVPRGIWFG